MPVDHIEAIIEASKKSPNVNPVIVTNSAKKVSFSTDTSSEPSFKNSKR